MTHRTYPDGTLVVEVFTVPEAALDREATAAEPEAPLVLAAAGAGA